MLPKVGIGRRCGAIQANVDRYRALMSDKLYEELLALGKELARVSSMEVNVFQRGCDVVIQKSLREGFGLVVSEALWKEKPVVAGNAGGIPMQFPEPYHKNLVESVEGCAERVLDLLKRPGERGEFGRAGREHVRKHFLLPRLVRDELRLIKHVVQTS